MSYEIFNKCKKYTYDSAFINFLTKCNIDDFPPNLTFNAKSQTIIFNNEKIKLDDKDIKDVTIILSTIFEKVESEYENIFNNIEEEPVTIKKRTKLNSGLEWKKLKSEVQDKYILKYLNELKKYYNLNKSETIQCEASIQLGLSLHLFPEIVLDETSILNIDGLIFDEIKRKFILPRASEQSSKKLVEKEIIKNNFIPYMNTYIKNFNNRLSLKF